MKIAIVGLGKMGGQIAIKLHDAGHDVIAYDVNEITRKKFQEKKFNVASSRQSVIDQFINNERVIIWLMIPSNYIDKEIINWVNILPKNSILIDGGNTDYRQDKKHGDLIKSYGSNLLDIGTSGGVWGMVNGFSMMVGGDQAVYEYIEPILKTMASPKGGYAYFGPNGYGHYVKMVHNAIEYGMMESLAEGYRVLEEGPLKNIDLKKAGKVWQESSVITSWLNDLTAQVLEENPNLNDISGIVAESGEARWTLETAKQAGIPLPAIQAAFDVRLASQAGEITFATKLLAAMRNKFGGHNIDGK